MYAKLTDFPEIKPLGVENRRKGAVLYRLADLAGKGDYWVFIGEYVSDKERKAGIFLETPHHFVELRSKAAYTKLLEPDSYAKAEREVEEALKIVQLGRYEKLIKSRRNRAVDRVESALDRFFSRENIELRAKALGEYLLVYNSPLGVFVLYERVKGRRYFRIFRKRRVELMKALTIGEEQVRKYANKVLYRVLR